MMDFKELERSFSAAIEDLIPAPTPDEPDEFEMVTLDRSRIAVW